MGECSIPDCQKVAHARGWCGAHYDRWRKYGDVRADVPLRRPPGSQPPPCLAEGCDRPSRKHGLCPTHADRLRHYGDILHGHQPQDGENNHNWQGDAITYAGMHGRLMRMLGRAKDYTCVDCGTRADDWSYIGPCPDERLDAKGRPWCTHIECFTTRCRSCHGLFDAQRHRII